MTAPVGYVGLHGRNYKEWFRKNAGRDERYDYLYTADELRPWASRVKEVAAKAKETYAVTNNHRLGKAPANAAMLESLVTGKKVEMPPSTAETHTSAELAPFTRAKPAIALRPDQSNARWPGYSAASAPRPKRNGSATRRPARSA